MSDPIYDKLTCSRNPVPAECAARIRYELRQKFWSGVSIGMPIGASIATAVWLLWAVTR